MKGRGNKITRSIYEVIAFLIALSLFMGPHAMKNAAVAEESSRQSDWAFVEDFVNRLRKHRPLCTSQDVYKGLFQYACGIEHLTPCRETAIEALRKELEAAAPAEYPGEPMIEFLSGDLLLCRLNLRPYKHHGGDPDRLFSVMMRSMENFRPSPGRFESLWGTYMDLVREGLLDFPVEEARSVDSEAKKHDYKRTFSHSRVYREHYRPSYRVILTEYLEELWRTAENKKGK
ncbi:MAG: hypothetical protein RDV48_12320 [Candidatus Eremiobacteraeota bacterium]|nr:hypothetical protein [Candidatus Eremiobacteraeota bacterium]